MKQDEKFGFMLEAKYKNVHVTKHGNPTVSFSREPKFEVLNFAEAIRKEEMEDFKQSYSLEYDFKENVIVSYLTGHDFFATHVKRLMERITTEDLKEVYEELINEQDFFLLHSPYLAKYKVVSEIQETTEQIRQRFHELLVLCNNYKSIE